MTNEIKVIVIEAGETAIKVIEKFDHSLENMQKLVGGWLEAVRVTDSITLWMNEEGKLQGLPPNFYLTDANGQPLDIVVGDVLIAGTKNHDTVSLTDAEIAEVQNRFLSRGQFNIR